MFLGVEVISGLLLLISSIYCLWRPIVIYMVNKQQSSSWMIVEGYYVVINYCSLF